jgi:hypothetical protein
MGNTRDELFRQAHDMVATNDRRLAEGDYPRRDWVAENRRILAWCRTHNLEVAMHPAALIDDVDEEEGS